MSSTVYPTMLEHERRPNRIHITVMGDKERNIVDLSLNPNPVFCTHHCSLHGWRNIHIDTPCYHMKLAARYMERLRDTGGIVYHGVELTPEWVVDFLHGKSDNRVIAQRRCASGCPVAVLLEAMTGERDVAVQRGQTLLYGTTFSNTDFIKHIVELTDIHDGGVATLDPATGKVVNGTTDPDGDYIGTLDVTVRDLRVYVLAWTTRFGNFIMENGGMPLPPITRS